MGQMDVETQRRVAAHATTEGDDVCVRLRARVGLVCLAVLPVVVWPGVERPFSTPKMWLIATAAVLLALRPSIGIRPLAPSARWLAAAWIGSFVVSGLLAPLPSFPALLLGVSAPLLAIALVRVERAPLSLVAAHTMGATTCAAVALMQWSGLDPFALVGWRAPIDGASVRMRVYGTLGNPNFVGVLMAMSLPLAWTVLASLTAPGRRRLTALALVTQAAALVATGSRGAVLGVGAAVAVYAVLRWSRRLRIGLAAGAMFGTLAVVVSPARPIDMTAAGRLYLWRIVAPHAWEAPLAGLGPGAVAVQFPEWQRSAAREGLRDSRFAGLTDHVHNDYLEALVERGLPGLAAVCGPLAVLLVLIARVPRPVPPVIAGASAAVAAGAACALVDFPLARPAELAVWWFAIVQALQSAATQLSAADRRHV